MGVWVSTVVLVPGVGSWQAMAVPEMAQASIYFPSSHLLQRHVFSPMPRDPVTPGKFTGQQLLSFMVW